MGPAPAPLVASPIARPLHITVHWCIPNLRLSLSLTFGDSPAKFKRCVPAFTEPLVDNLDGRLVDALHEIYIYPWVKTNIPSRRTPGIINRRYDYLIRHGIDYSCSRRDVFVEKHNCRQCRVPRTHSQGEVPQFLHSSRHQTENCKRKIGI